MKDQLTVFLYSLVMDTYSFGYSSSGFTDMPMNHKVFLAQFDAIKKLASEGPCVMVGRCADYALESYKNVVSVFIHADLDARIRRIARIYNLTDAKAKDMILKTDKNEQVIIIIIQIKMVRLKKLRTLSYKFRTWHRRNGECDY